MTSKSRIPEVSSFIVLFDFNMRWLILIYSPYVFLKIVDDFKYKNLNIEDIEGIEGIKQKISTRSRNASTAVAHLESRQRQFEITPNFHPHPRRQSSLQPMLATAARSIMDCSGVWL